MIILAWLLAGFHGPRGHLLFKLTNELLEKRKATWHLEKMKAQNSSTLIPRSCDLMQASISSSGKWEIS